MAKQEIRTVQSGTGPVEIDVTPDDGGASQARGDVTELEQRQREERARMVKRVAQEAQ